MYRGRRFEAPRKFGFVTEVLWRAGEERGKGKGKEREVAEGLLRCKGTLSLTQRGSARLMARGVNPRLIRRSGGQGREREREER